MTPTLDWRVSLADVTAAGAFSAFPGVDRTIVLVDGPQMTLTVDGTDHVLVHHRPFRFDGGVPVPVPVSASLPAGPTRALHVTTRRGRCRAELALRDAPAAWPTSGRCRRTHHWSGGGAMTPWVHHWCARAPAAHLQT